MCERVPLRSGSLKNTKALQPSLSQPPDTLNLRLYKCDGILSFSQIKTHIIVGLFKIREIQQKKERKHKEEKK